MSDKNYRYGTMLLGEISSRDDFGRMLSKKGLENFGAEVGTHRGAFAKILLDTWPGSLLCVDPWGCPPGFESQMKFLQGGDQKDRDADYEGCKRLLRPYRKRVMYMRMTSEQAVDKVADGSLDFVYLDGDHSFKHVTDDLDRWWPKVRKRGILAGHDFIMQGPLREDNWGQHVQPAVLAFAQAHAVNVYLVPERDKPWSYYMLKD